MTDLNTRLETAEEGSRELDEALARKAGTWKEKPVTAHDKNWWTPHYTTSLDASLPWENIVAVIEKSDGTGWMALHTTHETKEHHLAEAATEPLARRAAALKEKM